MRRGELWWASLRSPTGSDPGYRRPVLIVQVNEFTDSRIGTVICAAVTRNERLAAAPGNVVLDTRQAGLRGKSVINVSQIATVDKAVLTDRIGRVSPSTMNDVEAGLRLALSL